MLEWLCKEHAMGVEIVGIGRGGEGEAGEDDGVVEVDGDRGETIVGDGGTGIVVLDWVGLGGDWDLVRCIVGMNSRLMMREMSLTKGAKR